MQSRLASARELRQVNGFAGLLPEQMLPLEVQPIEMLLVCKKARPNQVALCGANPGQERAV